MNRILAIGTVTILLTANSSATTAQTSSPRGVTSQCSYLTCAMRIEPVFFGSALVTGANGESVTRLGGWGGGVDVLLAGPDSVAAYAHKYVTATRRSTVLGLLAAAAYTVALAHSDNFRQSPDALSTTFLVAGGGLAIATIPFTLRSQRSLSRSVWWYNAALPR